MVGFVQGMSLREEFDKLELRFHIGLSFIVCKISCGQILWKIDSTLQTGSVEHCKFLDGWLSLCKE